MLEVVLLVFSCVKILYFTLLTKILFIMKQIQYPKHLTRKKKSVTVSDIIWIALNKKNRFMLILVLGINHSSIMIQIQLKSFIIVTSHYYPWYTINV